MVLQGHWGPEDRHDSVAGEFVDGAAVMPHDRRSALDERGHDLAQSLGAHGRSDIHRSHHIGEQHRHLLVLRGTRPGGERRTAVVTEFCVRAQGGAASRASQIRGGHKAASAIASPPSPLTRLW